MPNTLKEQLLTLSLTLAAAAVGALAFVLIGFPAPYLTGPALAVSILAVTGYRVEIPPPLRTLCFLVLGVGIGASVTPDVIRTARTWPLSFAILSVLVIGSMLSCSWMLRRLFRFDALTAAMCAPPGHLSFVLSLAEDRGGDVRLVSLVQSTRVLFLTLVVPPILVPLVPPGTEGLTHVTMPAWHWLGILPVAYGLGRIYERLKIPAPDLLAAMTVSAAVHLSELSQGGLPPVVGNAAFAAMGALIGTRFVGTTLGLLRQGVLAGLAVTAVTVTWAVAAAAIAAPLLGFPLAKLLVAYAPGGLEAMAAMAVVLGLNPTFVAAHHVFRLVLLSFVIPFMGRGGRG